MSRYKLKSPNHPSYEIVVRWDKYLRTYVCIIQDLSIDEDEENIDPTILWIGKNYDEIMTVEELCHQIANFVTIPYETVIRLKQDALEPVDPNFIEALCFGILEEIERTRPNQENNRPKI